jgi:hypothetical protein
LSTVGEEQLSGIQQHSNSHSRCAIPARGIPRCKQVEANASPTGERRGHGSRSADANSTIEEELNSTLETGLRGPAAEEALRFQSSTYIAQ